MAKQISFTRVTRLVGRYQRFNEQMNEKLDQLADAGNAARQSKAWFVTARASISGDDGIIGQPLVDETFLPVMPAHAAVLPGNHEFFARDSMSMPETGLRNGMLLATIEQFAKRRATPINQFLYETT